MSVKLIRPAMSGTQRLYYRTHYTVLRGRVGGHYKGATFIPPKDNDEKGLFRLLDPDNVLACLRLYRWFHREHERNQNRGDNNFSGLIEKDDLMHQCFPDAPQISKVRIGRLLRLIVQYETNFQQNPGKLTGFRTIMNWRWCHTLEMIYGLEHLMSLWLPRVIIADGGKVESADDLDEEFEVIRDQSPEEDVALVQVVIDRKLI